MGRLLKAFFFKLSRDLTFRITLIIGAGIAVLMTGIYLAIDLTGASAAGVSLAEYGNKLLTGPTMLVASLSPAQNYGLAIPINVISFICLEFTQGSIRNKIIAGNSKLNIFISLFISGLIFCFALLGVYVLLCTGIGSIFGGFNVHGDYLLGGNYSPEYLIKFVILSLLVYASIVAFTVFIATTFRSVGPSIPIVIVVIVMVYLLGSLVSGILALFEKNETLVWVLRIIDPMYGISSSELKVVDEYYSEMTVTNETFISGICSNLFYIALFFFFGALEFRKRDVK